MILSIRNISRPARCLLVAIFSYVIFLAYLGKTLSEERFIEVFSEKGFFEEFSIVAWVMAAIAAIVIMISRFSLSLLVHNSAHALLFLMCAMREADWHKKFTTDGILKLRYYTTSSASLTEKIPAALVSLLFIALIIHTLARGYQYAKVRRHLFLESTWIMLGGISLFFVGKILDRSISVMTESFHFNLSTPIKHMISAQEEGLEMLTPILITLAFLWPNRKIEESKSAPNAL